MSFEKQERILIFDTTENYCTVYIYCAVNFWIVVSKVAIYSALLQILGKF